MVMRKKRFERLDLQLVQRSLELHSARKRTADHPQIIQLNLAALASNQLNSFIEASPGQPHMTRVKFGA